MRSAADEAARYREEVRTLQRENAELRRSQVVVDGIPKRDHDAALEDVSRLTERLSIARRQVDELARRLREKGNGSDVWRDRVGSLARGINEAQAIRKENERLAREVVAANKLKNAAIRKSKEKTEALQARINELECTLRALTNDN